MSASFARRWSIRIIFLLMAGGLSACAGNLERTPAALKPVDTNRTIRISSPVVITSTVGYDSTVRAGSTWRMVGTLPEGDVYRIENSVFTIEARNVHEAYLVVRERAAVGVYLPVEKAYSPLMTRIDLPLQQ